MASMFHHYCNNTDLVLHVIQFLPVTDSCRFSVTCKRHYFLVHKYREHFRSSQLVASTSNAAPLSVDISTTSSGNRFAANLQQNQNTTRLTRSRCNKHRHHHAQQTQQVPPKDVVQDCLNRIQTVPNVAIGFCKDNSNTRTYYCSPEQQLPMEIPCRVPSDTVILCANSPWIQSSGCNISRNRFNDYYVDNRTTTSSKEVPVDVESDSHSSLFLGRMEGTTITPFVYENNSTNPMISLNGNGKAAADDLYKRYITQNNSLSTISNSTNQAVILVYAVGEEGSGECDPFVRTIQAHMPFATIVGGLCTSAYVSVPIIHTPLYGKVVVDDDKLDNSHNNKNKTISDQESTQEDSKRRKGTEISSPSQYKYKNDPIDNLIESYTASELLFLYKALGGSSVSSRSKSKKRNSGNSTTVKDDNDDNNLDVSLFTSTTSLQKRSIAKAVVSLVQKRTYVLQLVEDGICGIIITGPDVPVKAVVSRGVISLTDKLNRPLNNGRMMDVDIDHGRDHGFEIISAEYVRPSDPMYLFSNRSNNEYIPSYHIIRQVRCKVTNQMYTAAELFRMYGRLGLVGIRARQQHQQQQIHTNNNNNNNTSNNNIENTTSGLIGYELHIPHPLSNHIDAFIIIASSSTDINDNDKNDNEIPINHTNTTAGTNSSITLLQPSSSTEPLIGYDLDVFDIDGPECMKDMDHAMTYLLNETTTATTTSKLCNVNNTVHSNNPSITNNNQNILGAIMYSCGGRGPSPNSLISEPMYDATCFTQYFPTTPLLGFYGFGEIGPAALTRPKTAAGTTSSSNSTLQTPVSVFSLPGTACLQGFTAVFALFIVPQPIKNSTERLNFVNDDSPSTINSYIQSKLVKTVNNLNETNKES